MHCLVLALTLKDYYTAVCAMGLYLTSPSVTYCLDCRNQDDTLNSPSSQGWGRRNHYAFLPEIILLIHLLMHCTVVTHPLHCWNLRKHPCAAVSSYSLFIWIL